MLYKNEAEAEAAIFLRGTSLPRRLGNPDPPKDYSICDQNPWFYESGLCISGSGEAQLVTDTRLEKSRFLVTNAVIFGGILIPKAQHRPGTENFRVFLRPTWYLAVFSDLDAWKRST